MGHLSTRQRPCRETITKGTCGENVTAQPFFRILLGRWKAARDRETERLRLDGIDRRAREQRLVGFDANGSEAVEYPDGVTYARWDRIGPSAGMTSKRSAVLSIALFAMLGLSPPDP